MNKTVYNIMIGNEKDLRKEALRIYREFLAGRLTGAEYNYQWNCIQESLKACG